MRRMILAFAVLFFTAPALAQNKDSVIIDLASDHVDITTGFNGTTIEVFGVRHEKGDIVVVVRGPERKMSVRRKESVLGAWVNRSFETFKNVPSYYSFATTAPLDKLAPPATLKKYGIGTENLQFGGDTSNERHALFREALMRNKKEQGLFALEPAAIKFMSPDFFRVDFYVPSNVPVGEYEIKTFYFSGGQVQDIKTRTLRVAQVGTSAKIHEFAHDNSLIYGVISVILAIFAGWFSNRVRRG